MSLSGILLIVALFPGKVLFCLLLVLFWMITKAWDLMGWGLFWLADHYKLMFILSGTILVAGSISEIIVKIRKKGRETKLFLKF